MRNSTDTKSCVGNATDGTDKRTLNQNRRLYWLLNELGLKDSVADLVSDETNGRTTHTSELTFIECMNLIRRLEQYTRKAQEKPTPQSKQNRMDKKRKGVIKAICAYGELCGLTYTVDYAKSIATRAAGRDSFNEITEGELTRIYNEFCRKQTAARARTDLPILKHNFSLN
ncbi:MAG: hypothetical protein AUK64_1502 [bacterium P201]|nr:MAG: hypothetical protein AUK64_1502 [bacterium P201]